MTVNFRKNQHTTIYAKSFYYSILNQSLKSSYEAQSSPIGLFA